jgi:hypothetical protein
LGASGLAAVAGALALAALAFFCARLPEHWVAELTGSIQTYRFAVLFGGQPHLAEEAREQRLLLLQLVLLPLLHGSDKAATSACSERSAHATCEADHSLLDLGDIATRKLLGLLKVVEGALSVVALGVDTAAPH